MQKHQNGTLPDLHRGFFPLLPESLQVAPEVDEESFQVRLTHPGQLTLSYRTLEIHIISGSTMRMRGKRERQSQKRSE